MGWTIRELAEMAGAKPANKPDATVVGFKPAAEACEGDLAFVTSPAWLAKLGKGAAAIAPPSLEKEAGDRPLIIADNPRLAYAKILSIVASDEKPPPGKDPSARIADSASIGKDAHIGATAFVGDGAKIGDRVVIHHGAYVAASAEVGDDCVIHPNAYIGRGCKLGNRVILGPGAVIGYDGFGYQWDGERHLKIPQVGTVVIGDDVEIGAMTAIDRAMLGETRVGDGTKIDNLVQIGHNCVIGKNVIIVSQVGLSGSVEVGDKAILAGQVGVADGVKIGAGAMIAGKGGIMGDVEPGARMGGFPVKKFTHWLRIEAVIDKLPEMAKRIRQLEKIIAELDKKKE